MSNIQTQKSDVKIESSSKDTDNTSAKRVKRPLSLDDVLTNELGFGWFQLRNIFLVAIPILVSPFANEYVFSAAAIPHRCRIPECGEVGKAHKYDPKWILNAVPSTSKGFDSCHRFAPLYIESNGTLGYCPANLFDNTTTIDCEAFVYANNNTVVYEFDLGCQNWLRALAGTLNSIGTLLVLPITGYISDRFGRRIALIISVLNLGAIGLIRAFSVNYTMYLILQILQTTLGAGTYSSAYIFVTELVGPKYRVLISATSSSLLGLGQMTLGGVAWLIPPWRTLLIALHIPCFFILFYFWKLSESLRWLLSKNKHSEAKEILLTIARVNKKNISEKSLNALLQEKEHDVVPSQSAGPGLVRSILNSSVLRRRVCITPIWWITSILVYYGLSINSTGLSDTMHLNYILTSAIEIPGYYTTVIVLDNVGRKTTLSSCYLVCAICNIAFVFIPNEMTATRLIIYLMGKFSISTVMPSMYLYTSELYPTEYRHTFLAFSSMVGRVGSIVAPLTPVLKEYWHGIPSFMFASMAMLSALLVFTQPETRGLKMPDSLAEAEAIGRSAFTVNKKAVQHTEIKQS
ncbi:solute carrier family 22 member 7-like [Bicyclus anynana]|uniref:Solute carrier family 22 member 7-like n=1 Tax=Bicyclus anynana TaxID=110368 RepID=A0ABM3LPL1_BICAN|nr:solute carrier family 22 member 7-like [Bicyclus anynana]